MSGGRAAGRPPAEIRHGSEGFVLIEKVLIYATSARGLLVFSEPDFPDIPLQVPGGTVEEGEPLIDAARREFGEETGLIDRNGFRRLGDSYRQLERGGSLLDLYRTYFHLPLEDDLPETWDHVETTPSGGGAPILFRFFWIDPHSARESLDLGSGEMLDGLVMQLSGSHAAHHAAQASSLNIDKV